MPIEIKELVIRAVAVKTDPADKKGLSKAAKTAQATRVRPLPRRKRVN